MIHIKKFTSKLSLVASAIALSGLSAMTVTFGAVAEESNADENIERINSVQYELYSQKFIAS